MNKKDDVRRNKSPRNSPKQTQNRSQEKIDSSNNGKLCQKSNDVVGQKNNNINGLTQNGVVHHGLDGLPKLSRPEILHVDKLEAEQIHVNGIINREGKDLLNIIKGGSSIKGGATKLSPRNRASSVSDEMHAKLSRSRTVSSSDDFDTALPSRDYTMSSQAGDLALFNLTMIPELHNHTMIPELHSHRNEVKKKAIDCSELESQIMSERNSAENSERASRNSADSGRNSVNSNISGGSQGRASKSPVGQSVNMNKCSQVEAVTTRRNSIPSSSAAIPSITAPSACMNLLSPTVIAGSGKTVGKGRGATLGAIMKDKNDSSKISIAG